MNWTCQCPRELADHIPVCGTCLAEQPQGDSQYLPICNACHTRLGLWTQLSRGEDEIWRCASCHIDYLKRRMEADPISPEDLAKCRRKIAEALARAGAKWATTRI